MVPISLGASSPREGSAASTASGVNVDAVVTDLRLVADSTHNSIGVYELQLFGVPASGFADPGWRMRNFEHS